MNNSAPFFSIIIPVYNRAGIICATLDSVYGQTYKNYEILIVDDGSTDETSEKVKQYPEARYIKQKNAGPGAARAKGAELSQGKYLVFLDSDDLWLPWTLEVYHEAIIKNNNPSLVLGSFYVFHDPHEIQFIQKSELKMTCYKDYLDAWANGRQLGKIQGCNSVYLLEEYKKAGGCTTVKMNCEDIDLFLRMGTSPGMVTIHSPQTYAYRKHTSQLVKQYDMMLKGLRHLLTSENTGLYPGGPQRQKERLNIICFTARGGSGHAMNGGDFKTAITAFKMTFKHQIQRHRWKYLLGFYPLLLMKMLLRKSRHS